jgi:hypothetical protein
MRIERDKMKIDQPEMYAQKGGEDQEVVLDNDGETAWKNIYRNWKLPIEERWIETDHNGDKH